MDQAVGLALEVFGLPAAVAGLIAALTVFAVSKLSVATPSAGLSVGFFAGYLCSPREVAPLVPQHSWHWLPYIGLAADVAGDFTGRVLGRRVQAATALVVIPLIVGALVTPNWPVFGLNWPLSIVWLALYVAAIAAGLWFLPEMCSGRPLIALMALAAVGLAGAIAAMISFRLAQLAGITSLAIVGCLAGSVACKPTANWMRGLGPVYATLAGGTAFVACVYNEPPLTWLLLLPAIPLAIAGKCAFLPRKPGPGRTPFHPERD